VCYLRETLAVEKNEQVTIKIEMFWLTGHLNGIMNVNTVGIWTPD
jgi:hypothetical protein